MCLSLMLMLLLLLLPCACSSTVRLLRLTHAARLQSRSRNARSMHACWRSWQHSRRWVAELLVYTWLCCRAQTSLLPTMSYIVHTTVWQHGDICTPNALCYLSAQVVRRDSTESCSSSEGRMSGANSSDLGVDTQSEDPEPESFDQHGATDDVPSTTSDNESGLGDNGEGSDGSEDDDNDDAGSRTLLGLYDFGEATSSASSDSATQLAKPAGVWACLGLHSSHWLHAALLYCFTAVMFHC